MTGTQSMTKGNKSAYRIMDAKLNRTDCFGELRKSRALMLEWILKK
jgi:hypothetical protein